RPAELLACEFHGLPGALTGLPGFRAKPEWDFDQETAVRLLTRHFFTKDLGGFGADNLTAAIGAAGCLFAYAQETQRTTLSHIACLAVEPPRENVTLDPATRRNLELDT